MERRVLPVPRRTLMLALPGLTLAVAGLFHPHHLTYDTAWRWFSLHVPGLLVFPLVGWALADLMRGRRDPAAWLVRVAPYLYATFYTALDVVSGVAAGYVTHQLGPGVPRPQEVSLLFRLGTPLGHVGSVALVACCALVTVDQLVRRRAWPSLVLVPGALLVPHDHIFAPTGVAGMFLLGVGTAATAWSARPATFRGVAAS